MSPSRKEIDAAIKEENEAMLEFAAISKKSGEVELEKKAARLRLTIARDTKRALLDDLMTL